MKIVTKNGNFMPRGSTSRQKSIDSLWPNRVNCMKGIFSRIASLPTKRESIYRVEGLTKGSLKKERLMEKAASMGLIFGMKETGKWEPLKKA